MRCYTVLILVLISLLFAGCSKFKLPQVGNSGEPCFDNGTCKDGLLCVDGICIDPEKREGEDGEEIEDTDYFHNIDDAEYEDDNGFIPDDIKEYPDNENDDEEIEVDKETFSDEEWIPDDDIDEDILIDDDFTVDDEETGDEDSGDEFSCAAAVLGGGSGTSISPYLVSMPRHLDEVRCFPNAHFEQTADIDLIDYLPPTGWVPIGDLTEKFTGTYDGQGFIIRNLYINNPSKEYQGLFGYLQNSVIKNVRIENVEIHGGSMTGALAGFALKSTISKCSVEGGSGSIKGNNNVGGLIGYSYDGSEITRSHSLIDVEGNENVGGLVGMSYWSDISRSYSRGSVSGNKFIGGFAGYIMGNSTDKAYIENSFSRGTVTRKSGENPYVGSFAGIISFGEIHYSYSTSKVVYNGFDNPVDKGFVGGETEVNSFSANFFDIGETQQTEGIGAEGKTTPEMKSHTTYTGSGWDFEIWGMASMVNDGYPYLKN